MACAPSDECHDAGACDATSGTCSNPAKKDGEACTGGTCKNAKCVTDGSGRGATGEAGAGDATGTGETVDGGTTGGTAGTADAGGNASDLYVRNPGGCAFRARGDREHDTNALIGVALAALAIARGRRRQRDRRHGRGASRHL